MYHKHVLPNGLRVLTAPMRGTQAATVLVLVKTGSKYEEKETAGVSHFLEHMFFKGSNKFPTVRALTEALDRLGAEYNAFTDKEMTGFWVKVAASSIEEAVAIVGDMLKTPRFPKREMERERGVILEELNLYFDTPIRFIGDLWEKVLYGDQPAGRYVGGTPETVSAIQHRHIVEHFKTYYRAPAMVVVLAGALSHVRGRTLSLRHFRGIRGGATPEHLPMVDKQRAPQVLTHRKHTDQTHLAVGVRTVSMTHPMRYPLAVLAVMLGGTMSSRLFLLIRDKLGLAYSVRTSADFDVESGSLVTLAGVKNASVHKVAAAILQEYRKCLRTTPSLAEVRKAQQAMIGHFVLGLEQTDEVAAYLAARELLTEKIILPEEQIRAIRAVTPKAIWEAARFVFRRERLNLALIGPDSKSGSWYDQLDTAFPR